MPDIHSATLIKAYIDAKPDKVYDSWRCSSLGGCMREHFYKRLGIKETKPKDDRTLRKFEAGNIFHDFIQGITEKEVDKLGGKCSNEVELFDKKLDLGGRYDMLIELDGKRILKDIKSQHSGFFHKLERAAKMLMAPDGTIYDAGKKWRASTPEERQEFTKKALWAEYPHMVKQLGGYMLMLKRAGQPVDEGVIIRVSKDDLSLAEVHFELTPELEKIVLDEVNELNQYWNSKKLPPCKCPDLYGGKQVEWCIYGQEDGKKCCSEKLFNERKK